MLLTHHVRRQDTGGGVQGVNCGINAQRGNTAVQNGGGVQMGEGGSGSGVGQVVGGDVDSLNGGDSNRDTDAQISF